MAQTVPGRLILYRRQASLAVRHWAWPLALLGALLALLVAWAAAWPPAVTAPDLNLRRADLALPVPRDDLVIRQRFTPGRNGLAEVELLLVRHGERADDRGGRLTLRLLDERGAVVAARDYETAGLTHNQTILLRVPPQPASAGRFYTLEATGNAANPISLWATPLDLHAGGELTLAGADTAARDLRLVTRYRLDARLALADLAALLGRHGPLLTLSLLHLFMPGALLLTLAGRRLGRWDPAAWWGVAAALGAAVWPLLWLWLSLVGGRWTGWLLWALLLGGWAATLARWRRRRQTPWPITPRPSHLLLLALLLLGLAVRLLAVRDLAFPPWVDASRHALITAVMVENGRLITGYEPLLPIARFPYHAGFHTLPAGLALMTARPLPGLLLVLGQLLNALVPLAVYAAAWLLTRRRGVALAAAFLVALPFFFPAYYTTWGRLTQLTAVLILPVVLALTWRLVRGARAARRGWWLVALLAAGLFFVHFRVFLLYLPFAVLLWTFSLGRGGRPLAAAAALALLLVAPRLVQLATDSAGLALTSGAPADYNAFPLSYVQTGWERYFLAAAVLALLLAIPAAVRRRPWATLPAFLALWAGAVLLLLSGRAVGLPGSWLINLNSAYITLFIPLSLLLALTTGQLWRRLAGRYWLWQVVGYAGAGALALALLLFGLRQQVSILNPQTILAEPADLPALDWLAANTPTDAYVAVGAWRWLGSTWAGSDGGAWVVPLTGRRATTPPADYIYSRPLAEQVNAFNEAASRVEDWSRPEAADWLRRQGVTHVFVGARGGFLDPAALARNPELSLRYVQEGVFIFELRPAP